MKNIILIITLLIINSFNVIIGQNHEIIDKINKANDKITSIESSFTRTKHLILMKKDVVSKGDLYFKDNKLSMIYSKPKDEVFIINGDKIFINSLGKKNTFNAKSNAMMAELSNMLINSMNGDIDNIINSNEGKIEYSSDNDNYIFVMTKNVKPKKGCYKIVTKYDKKDYIISELVIYQVDNSYTTYSMKKKQLDSKIDDNVFIFK